MCGAELWKSSQDLYGEIGKVRVGVERVVGEFWGSERDVSK